MDLLSRGSDWLEEQRHKQLSRLVTYRRGGDAAELAATIGKTTFELDDGAGAVLRVESRDYLIRVSDLVLDGNAILPQRGDQIEETDAASGNTIIYEVGGFGDQPHFRFSDVNRRTLRIHSKQTDET